MQGAGTDRAAREGGWLPSLLASIRTTEEIARQVPKPYTQIFTVAQVNRGFTFAMRRSTLDFCLDGAQALHPTLSTLHPGAETLHPERCQNPTQ